MNQMAPGNGGYNFNLIFKGLRFLSAGLLMLMKDVSQIYFCIATKLRANSLLKYSLIFLQATVLICYSIF